MDGEATPITAGALSFLVPGWMTVNLTLGPSGESSGKAIALAGPYRRVTPDSVVFPSIATPELFVRRTGNSIVIVTQSAGAAVGPALRLGGAHRFTFLQDP